MVPTIDEFSRAEWQVVRAHRTPVQVQGYLNALAYNDEAEGGTLRSFRGVVGTGRAHCLEAALAAAVILEQHGYPVQLLDLESWDSLDHVLFLYRKKGKWGTVARSRDPGLHGRKPVFASLRELVDSYFDTYVDLTGRIIGYGVIDLTPLGRYNWRLSSRNVWKVEQFLRDMPHQRFARSEARYRFWHRRYQAYRQRYPDRKPLYYDNRRTWAVGYPKGKR